MLTPDSIDRLLSSLTDRGFSSNTVRAYRSDLLGLLAWSEQEGQADTWTEMETLSAKYLTQNRATWKPATLNRRLIAIRKWAANSGAPENFLHNYMPGRLSEAQPKPLLGGTCDVVKLVLATSKREHKILLILCGMCGLRVAEAISIKYSDLDQRDWSLTVRGKGDKIRVIPLPREAIVFIKDLLSGVRRDDDLLCGGLTESGARKVVHRLAERAGLPDTSSHQLRSTFATELNKRTDNTRLVQIFLGHANIQTTTRYTKVTLDDMRRIVA